MPSTFKLVVSITLTSFGEHTNMNLLVKQVIHSLLKLKVQVPKCQSATPQGALK
jgi:hypothetical protein